MPTFVITGLDDIDRKLRTLEPRVAKKVLRQAMRKAMKRVQTMVKELAPERSGELKRAIKVRAARRTRKKQIRINVRIGKGDFKGDTYYGAMVEYGTKKQQGQHFMETAFKLAGARAREDAIEAITQGIEEQAEQG